jgi:predicted GNAT family acetyltransferase
MSDATGVTRNDDKQRYELEVDGDVAFADYQLRPGLVLFTHTVVPRHLEGKGIGTRLMKGALADVRTQGLQVVPRCSFVATYFERFPEERDLLAGTPNN